MQECWARNHCNGVDCDAVFCMKKFKLDALFEASGLPVTYKDEIALRVDADKGDLEAFTYLKSIMKKIDKFVEAGDSLYIHSPTSGNGKTSWAVKLMKAYMLKIWYKADLTCKVLFVHVPRFLLALKDNISVKSEYVQYIKDNILEADLVVFDEIGTKNLSSFEFEHILSYVNARLDAKKANIYTSNLTNEEMLEKVGQRLYSRIVHSSNDVELVGCDKRGIKA